jgi:ubiquinone/menaquinone biosynthesis C-methylase UbiE
MEDILRLEFNEWAKAGRGESMERGHRPVGEQAIEKMRVPDVAAVLDVGCGSGWASRLLAEKARRGRVVGIDISDEMIRVATEASNDFSNLAFQVASAEDLPFEDSEFTHAFSMESLYYYADMSLALSEIRRALVSGGLFVTVIDLYQENKASHQWIEKLQVPVQLLSTLQYHSLLEQAGFVDVRDERIRDPAPIVDDYTGTSFRSHEDYLEYRAAGSLMLSARAGRRGK